ncbi:nuclear pore complex protein Nup153 [Silurus meridionalis]|uniref:Nuclear pore complex protein Nup153 n=1 Tax=Silurus meridionalis TaxID=175797 RepID=A0A8T0AK69_SILME|nr:nuclear pore complex protein Nup153 [Silurus meridionalis]KAF7691157.1 hypothetical protein HF521_011454 [Silurus meridionalis]
MAAAGGGKIRTRRHHIVSKPYAKGRQQPGLISRVTDTVKSIVPSWLQKYFKNGEVDEGGETHVQVEQNNIQTPPNGNQDAAPLPTEHNSPEPSTSNAEPSTSRASLNFQDVLSRPPLNRSHLHFPSHDGSPALGGSLFSQPSTSTSPFPASPFAVSSSFPLVKEIKDSSSQHEDDNISTTSGFSSRASDKDVPTSKSAPLLWSPETERAHSGSQLAHSSLKKPAFNLSVFSTSSATMNSSVVNSSQLGDSPFYPGKTMYGGAAAAKTARSRPGTPYQAPVRRQIKAKPAGAQPCGVTSATARRILQSLERMSSPLADAKRIPSTVSSPLSASMNHTDLEVSSFQSKRKKLEPAVPPVQKLVIPAVAAVSGNRSMSFRPSLTPGSVSRVVEKASRETPARRSPQIPGIKPAASASTSNLLYPLSSTPAASVTGAGGGKMKRERSVRPSIKRPEDEVVESPNLPAVSLPISNFNLPTFSFSSPPPASTLTISSKPMPQVSEQVAVSKEIVVSTPGSVSFTFSSPIVKATAASPMTFSPSSGFTFSAPTMKTPTSMSNGKLAPAKATLKTASESSEEFEGPFKPAKSLKQGSVLDILKGPGFASSVQNTSETEPAKPRHSTTSHAPLTSLSGFAEKFKPAAGSWNCDTCLLQNKPSDKKCVACQAPQPSTDSSSKSDSKPAKASAASLSSLFTPPAGSWECDTCLVQNKPEVVKCVACDTAKPGTGVKPALSRPSVSEVSSNPPASSIPATTFNTTSGLLTFADKFKKPEGAWDCDICMVQNKAQDVKCVACLTAKPGGATAQSSQAPSSLPPASTPASTAPPLGFGDKFKKPEGSWECDVCCVQNKAEDQQCVACQTNKPGAKVETKGFGTPSSSNSVAFKFGTSNSSNSASGEVKFGGTFSDSASTVSFKFGNASSDSSEPAAGFKFGDSSSDSILGAFKQGVSTQQTSTTSSSTGSFKFGESSDGFKFGAVSTPESTSEEKKSESENSGAGFKFGGSSTISFGSNSINTVTTTASGGFAFGLSKPEVNNGSNPSFILSTPKAKAEKEDPPVSTQAVSATANTAPVFGKPPVTEPTTAELFVEAIPKTTTTTAFMFGKTEEKKDAPAPSTGFLFGASKEAEKPAPTVGFSFSKPEPQKDLPKPTFAFGKPAEPTETPKPAFSFGQNATDNAPPKPVFSFMGSSSTTSASSNLFGPPSSLSLAPTPTPNSTFVFGQGSSSDAASKTFMFGQQQEAQPASAEPSAAPNSAPTFVFGSVNNSNASPFAFGGSASTPASTAPAPSANPTPFGFTAPTSTSGFGSGQTMAFGASQSTVPAFGSAASSFTATASAAPAFGSKPSAPPVFGQQPNSTPAFGSSAPSGQGGFQFGGATAFGPSSNNSSIFTFGGGAGATPSPAASPAMSAQPTAPGGGFNFSQTPAFNIGAAKSSNVTPTGQHGIAGRKIKTAVRRRK